MKNYREIADSVFARREQYVIAQRKKKQLVTRVTASVGSVALVSLASFALFKSDAFRETPPLSDGGATTTTTHIPTEGEDTTTTTVNTTVPAPTTDGGIVTPPTTAPTTVPAPSKPTATQAPTTGKTEPPKTTPNKTEPSKTNPTQPTATQTKPTATQTKPTATQTKPTATQTKPTATQTKPTATQTKPTQTTPTTQPTVPPVEDDYIVVETPVGSEPGNPYMISAKIPAQCSAADEFVPISLSYGVGENTFAEGPAHVVLYYYDGKNESIFKRIERQDFITDYVVQYVWDEDRMWIVDYIYSHTETILFPLSLCSKDSGRIWIVLADGTSDEKDGILTDGYLFCVSSVCFDYVRSGTNITFYAVK